MSLSVDQRVSSDLLGYRIEAVLGRGGMGVVYRAEDARLKRKVALKLLAPELAQDGRFRERFLQESELAASLDHPNVIPIYEAGEADGLLFLAMRYVEGADLKTLLREEGSLEPARAIAICSQAADALDAAHDRGLVHRDVKPSNVLLDRSEHVYLADFGLTRRLSEQASRVGEGQSLGTPSYLAPEQIERRQLDGMADLYSLGCVLLECLTGEPPFRDAVELAVMFAHLEEEPPRASERNPELPEAIDPVLWKAMAKEPDERYGSCRELVEAAAGALGISAEALARRPPLYRRGEFLAAAGAAIAASSALAAVLLTRGGGGGPPKSLVRIDPRTGKVSGFAAGSGGSAIAVGQGAVWIASANRGTVTRIDPTTGAAREVPTDGTPSHIAVHGRTLVAVNGPLDHEVAALNTKALRLRGAVSLAGAGYAESARVAAGDEGVWLVNINDNAARRVELGPRLALGKPITLFKPDEWGANGSFNGIAVGHGAVWVTGDALNQLLFRIDPVTQRVERIPLEFAPKRVAVGYGAIWIGDQLGNAVWRIDTQSRKAQSIAVGQGPDGLAAGEGGVWVVNAIDGTASKIDPERREVVDEIELGEGFREVAAGLGGVWAVRSS